MTKATLWANYCPMCEGSSDAYLARQDNVYFECRDCGAKWSRPADIVYIHNTKTGELRLDPAAAITKFTKSNILHKKAQRKTGKPLKTYYIGFVGTQNTIRAIKARTTKEAKQIYAKQEGVRSIDYLIQHRNPPAGFKRNAKVTLTEHQIKTLRALRDNYREQIALVIWHSPNSTRALFWDRGSLPVPASCPSVSKLTLSKLMDTEYVTETRKKVWTRNGTRDVSFYHLPGQKPWTFNQYSQKINDIGNIARRLTGQNRPSYTHHGGMR